MNCGVIYNLCVRKETGELLSNYHNGHLLSDNCRGGLFLSCQPAGSGAGAGYGNIYASVQFKSFGEEGAQK